MGLSVIILAAGQGTRMRSALPKVLQTLAGKPLLGHVLSCSEALGADDICVVYGHGGEAVKAAFPGDSFRWALQAEQLGTGHAMQQAMPGTPDDNQVLVLFGDVPLLQPDTLRVLLAETPADDMAVLTVDMDDPKGYGRVVRENGGVRRIVEEKDADAGVKMVQEINTGVMVCPARRLKAWLDDLSNDNAQGEYYLTDTLEILRAAGKRVSAYRCQDPREVLGVNSPDQLMEAEQVLAERVGSA